MSHADYHASHQLAADSPPLPVLIMTAMQVACRPDQERLRAVFPQIWTELLARERSWGGLLEHERVVTVGPPEHARTATATTSRTDTHEESRP